LANKRFFFVIFFFDSLIFYSLTSYFLIKICIKNTTNKDPKYIVADEHIGQSISLIFCEQEIVDYLLALCLFRFFDIVKPFPINLVDNKVKNAFGVILDDVLAGLFVCIIIAYAF
jgi:phosphatidylglycerophosphatase A